MLDSTKPQLKSAEKTLPARTRRQRVSAVLPQPLADAIAEAARGILKNHVIHDKPRANQAARLFLHALYPSEPGRPKSSDVTTALQLKAEGKSNKEIYRLLGKTTQPEQHSLREAMRQRKIRERRRAARDKPAPSVTPTN
jgi:hypothetical protein